MGGGHLSQVAAPAQGWETAWGPTPSHLPRPNATFLTLVYLQQPDGLRAPLPRVPQLARGESFNSNSSPSLSQPRACVEAEARAEPEPEPVKAYASPQPSRGLWARVGPACPGHGPSGNRLGERRRPGLSGGSALVGPFLLSL